MCTNSCLDICELYTSGDDMNQFGYVVKEYLLKNDLKQQNITDKLGTSKGAVSQLLNRDNISLDKMQAIAEALECDLKITLEPRGDKPLK